MKHICEVCGKSEVSKLCDYKTGSGVITSTDFKELTFTCDKKLCKNCATNLWIDCDLCPEHAQQVKTIVNCEIEIVE